MVFKLRSKKLAKRKQRLGMEGAESRPQITAYRLSGATGIVKKWSVKNLLAPAPYTRTRQGRMPATSFERAVLPGVWADTVTWEAPQSPAKPPTFANAFAHLVHALARDRNAAIAAIRHGFPATVIKDASAYFEVPATRIRNIVRVPETTAAALAKRGANLDTAASERLWRLADLVAMAEDVFEDNGAAREWLRTSNRTFQDAAPMDFLDTELGAMAVRQVLNAIATGGAA